MKKIAKAILLWGTAFSTIALLGGGFASLVWENKDIAALVWVIINTGLMFAAFEALTYEEVLELSGMKWIYSHFSHLLDEDEDEVKEIPNVKDLDLLSDEELKELFADMEADRFIEETKSNQEGNGY
jgi:hypothetical protein